MSQLVKSHSVIIKSNRHSPMPILKNVCANGKLVSTNLEQWLITENPGMADGCYLIKGSNFYPSQSTLDKFPKVPEGSIVFSNKIDTEFFKTLKAAMLFCSKEDTRPAMQCINIEFKTDKSIIVATDGYRLFYKTIKGEFNEGEIKVPAVAIKYLSQIANVNKIKEFNLDCLFDKSSDKPNHVKFSFGSSYFLSWVPYEKFPDYPSIIPLHFENKVTFSTSELLEKVLSVSEILEKKHSYCIKFLLESSQYKLFAENINDGLRKTETLYNELKYSGLSDIPEEFILLMPCSFREYNEEPLNFMLHAFLLIDCLKQIKKPKVEFHYNKNSQPFIILGRD